MAILAILRRNHRFLFNTGRFLREGDLGFLVGVCFSKRGAFGPF